jgi:ketosteroid isomerase-like protein
MKKNLILAASGILCMLISCKKGPETKSDMDEIQKNLDINAKAMKAIESGDATAIDTLIADDVVDHMGPHGKEIKGGSTLKPMLIDMHNHWKGLKFDVITSSANKDYVFTLSKTMGTATDTTMGMAAGTKMEENMVDLVKIRGGKVVEHWGFVDPSAMMKKMHEMHGMEQKMQAMPKK